MPRVSYPEEAKSRISGFSAESIVKFIDEVSKPDAKAVLTSLPKIPGFRENQATDKQKKRLAERLAGKSSDASLNGGRAWRALGDLWVAWGMSVFGEFKPFELLVDRLSDTQPASDDTTLIPTFIAAAKEANYAREDVSRLLVFGPFADAKDGTMSLDSLEARSAIERKRTIDQLPSEVPELTRRVNELFIEVQRLRTMSEKEGLTSKALHKGAQLLDRRADESEKSVTRLIESLTSVRQQLAAQDKSHKTELARLAKGIDASSDTLKQLQRNITRDLVTHNDFKVVDELLAESQRAKAARAVSQEELDELRNSFNGLLSGQRSCDTGLKTTEEIVGTLLGRVERLEGLSNRLADTVGEFGGRLDAESARFTQPSGSQDNPKAEVADGGQDRALNAVWKVRRRPTEDRKIENIGSVADALRVLINNLEGIGLQKGSARSLAREILAAAMSGQLIGFSGSMARSTMLVAAKALCAQDIFEVDIPVGLTHDVDLLDRALKIEDNNVECLALLVAGINRSDFDIYGRGLRDWSIARQLTPDKIWPIAFVFYDICPTPAGLPIPTSLAEVGPILDTDALLWRVDAKPAVPMLGQLWLSKLSRHTLGLKADFDVVNRLLDLTRDLAIEPSIVWWRSISEALACLRSMGAEATACSSLQSVTYGWLLPWTSTVNCAPEALDSILEATSTDDQRSDPRIARLVERMKILQK